MLHLDIFRARPLRLSFTAAALVAAGSVQAQVQITEWMYNGTGGAQGGIEFIEFTNLGATAVDFSGWSFDDDSRVAGTVSLSAFGLVAPGESVILAESTATNFRTVWSLAGSIKVIGGNTTNLGGGDEINLFDAGNALVDRLTYNTGIGAPVANGRSGTPVSLAALGPDNAASGWVLSAVGDAYGSYASSTGNIANPGLFALAVPEPGSLMLLLAGLGLVSAAARRRS